VNTAATAGYILAGIAITSTIALIVLEIWACLQMNPKYHPFLRKKAERMANDTVTYTCASSVMMPHDIRVNGRKYRGKMKKSLWAKARKADKKEARK
jgi:hypothetical protein